MTKIILVCAMLWTIIFNNTIFSMFTMHRTIITKKLHTQSQQFSNKKITLIKKDTKSLDQTKKEKIQKLIDTNSENYNEIHQDIGPIDHPYSVYLYWQTYNNKQLEKKE